MITISTRDYTTDQLKDLAEGLSCTATRISDSPECKEKEGCNPGAKLLQYVGIYVAQENISGKR